MRRRLGTKAMSAFLAAAMTVSMFPVQALANDEEPVAQVDADGWVLQRQSTDTNVELQEGWIVPDEDGNGVTIDYGKIVNDTGNEGWVVFDSDEPKYKDSSLEYDITFSESTQGDWIAVAPATRVTDGKNYEGFAITNGTGLERTGRKDGSESYAGIDNLLGLKFEYDKTYHIRMETIGSNITVYVTRDGKEEKQSGGRQEKKKEDSADCRGGPCGRFWGIFGCKQRDRKKYADTGEYDYSRKGQCGGNHFHQRQGEQRAEQNLLCAGRRRYYGDERFTGRCGRGRTTACHLRYF